MEKFRIIGNYGCWHFFEIGDIVTFVEEYGIDVKLFMNSIGVQQFVSENDLEPLVNNLLTWQSRHGFTYETAAAALGVSRRTYARYLKKAELPKLVILAMERIDEQKGMK